MFLFAKRKYLHPRIFETHLYSTCKPKLVGYFPVVQSKQF